MRVSKKMKSRARLEDVFDMGSPEEEGKQDTSSNKRRRVMFQESVEEIKNATN